MKKYKLYGRDSEIGMVWNFCVANSYVVTRKAVGGLTWSVEVSESCFDALMEKDWFVKADIECYQLNSKTN
ncbi:MAG: hypothetical protein MJZ41_06380 [Bacteroidaceae bacterium]|nr:hypothetical protein [Bacteroidaceae bacterium]